MTEQELENSLIGKLKDLKYVYRDDIHNRQAMEANFREKFEALNHIKLSS